MRAVRARGRRLARLAGALLALASMAPAPAGAAGILPHGPLRPAGRWLVDTAGRVVILHGLQVAHKTRPYYPPPRSFDADDGRLIARLGFNAVRLAWFWNGLEPVRGRYDQRYLDEYVRQARVVTSHRAFLLPDAQQDYFGAPVRGAGFPDWATFADGMKPGSSSGFPAEDPAVTRAFENLYVNRAGTLAAFAAAWQRIAASLRYTSMIAGYDLINEPWAAADAQRCARSPGCPSFDRYDLGPVENVLAGAVRRVDPSGVLFYEPTIQFDFGTPSFLPRPPAGLGPVGFAFHAYCGGDRSTPAARRLAESLCSAQHRRTFGNARVAAARLGGPSLFGEFGDTQDLAEIAREIRLADSRRVGWVYWAYKDWKDVPGGPGSGPLFGDSDRNATLRLRKADVVSEPYPMATAGVPLVYRFNPRTRSFFLAYRADARVTAPTVVFVPARHYRHGYRVRVRGARVTSPRGATYLLLRARRGARGVSVRVVPAR